MAIGGEEEVAMATSFSATPPPARSWEYTLTIPYRTEAELDAVIADLLQEAVLAPTLLSSPAAVCSGRKPDALL